MGLRYEAWTTPWSSAGFSRKIARIPVEEDSGQGDKRFLSTAGQGSMTVLTNEDFGPDRLALIAGPATNSLIRVYDGADLVHEWLCERAPADLSDEIRRANLSGPGLEAIFDRYIIYPREYPDDFTGVQDTIWAGDNVLDNPDMEESQTQNEKYEVWADATGGDFTLTVMGQTTAAIAWNASVGVMEDRLQALSNVDDVLVSAGDDPGTEDDPWQIEFIVPAIVDPNMTVDDTGLTGATGQVTIKQIQAGQDDIPVAWTTSRFADQKQDPRLHGTYSSDGFRRDDTVAHSGTYSLRINPLSRYGGAQQVVQVEPGMTYQASIWVYTTDATETFKFVARSAYVDGEAPPLAQDGGSIPASTWTEFTFEVFVPPDVNTLIFRIAAVGNENPIPFWVDDAALLEGFAATTVGAIAIELLDDATLDHAAHDRGAVLEWIDYTSFDAALDSNGNAWNQNIGFTARFGETYGQILDKFVDLGYEWELVAKATPVGVLTHDFHLYNPDGRDDQPGVGINIRGPVIGGDVVNRSPDYTAVFVEGTTSFIELESAAAADFGRFEKLVPARDTADNDTLTLLGEEALSAEETNRRAVRFEVADIGPHRPFVHYQLGDTVSLQAPPHMAKEDRRIQEVSYANTNPTTYQIVGSRAFPGEAAAYELIRRLWRRFSRPEIPRRRGAANIPTSTGGMPTIVIAAPDSTVYSKARADFVVSDLGVQAEINTSLFAVSGATAGRVVLTEGTYVTNATITVPDGVTLELMPGSLIEAGVPTDDWAIEINDGSVLEGGTVNSTGHGVRVTGLDPS